jgi:hypothetical protein
MVSLAVAHRSPYTKDAQAFALPEANVDVLAALWRVFVIGRIMVTRYIQ